VQSFNILLCCAQLNTEFDYRSAGDGVGLTAKAPPRFPVSSFGQIQKVIPGSQSATNFKGPSHVRAPPRPPFRSPLAPKSPKSSHGTSAVEYTLILHTQAKK
jgi:hypothetical protein